MSFKVNVKTFRTDTKSDKNTDNIKNNNGKTIDYLIHIYIYIYNV